MTAFLDSADDLVAALKLAGTERGSFLALSITGVTAAPDAADPGSRIVAFASVAGSWVVQTNDRIDVVAAVEKQVRPRWVWWSSDSVGDLTKAGLRVAMCWDIAAVHRLLFGGWKAEPARVWAVLHAIPVSTVPVMGQMGLLDNVADEGDDLENPVRPDGHLRPEWTAGGWADSPLRAARWAATALHACELQRRSLRALPGNHGADTTARSESAAALLCKELEFDGLPLNVEEAEAIIALSAGPRPRSESEVMLARERRDAVVLEHVPAGGGRDLRNPAHVRSMLASIGVSVTDTRAWRLEPFRDQHPLVDALLTWRKAERIATTYGYTWLDEHVSADGRLRGTWTSCDGAAGRMTAQAGLHNLPKEMRGAVVAEDGYVFVHADLGQIEPRVLAAVSGDSALAAATVSDDLYAPIALRLGVERAVAKVAVLAAMYGQTSGAAGEALRGMESAYPVAMQFLRDADRRGQEAPDVRTYGGRLVRMSSGDGDGDGGPESRSVAAARGRYARNAVIQGAAAELFKAWAVTVRARTAMLGAHIVLCLHDELLVHVPEEHGLSVVDLLEAALPEAAQRWMPDSGVRYVAKANVFRSWAEAKS